MKKFLSSILIIALTFVMVFSGSAVAFGAEKAEIRQAYEATANYLLSNKDANWYESLWSALPLKLSGLLTEAQENDFRTWAEDYIVSKEGKLTTNYRENPSDPENPIPVDSGMYTEFSKMVILCCEFGMDPRNVGGYNIVDPLANMNKVVKQGINGPIWALMALDRAGYEFSEGVTASVTQEILINFLLSNQLSDGGWALMGTKADPDITGMTVIALAPHKDDPRVSAAFENAAECMKDMETSSGGFATVMETGAEPTSTSESDVQIITAMCLIGIDPFGADGFVKHGSAPLDDLMSYYIQGTGTFKHIAANTKGNYLATSQAFYALAHYYKFISDMTAEEEAYETERAHAYILKIGSLKEYIEELKAMIADSAPEIEKYKADAEKYKTEAEKYKAEAEKYKADAEKYKNDAITNGIKATTVKLTVSKASGSAKLKWSKTGSYAVDKYQIYRSTKETSGFKSVATKAKSVSTYKDTTVKKGKTYYYKVRGFRTVNGKKVYTQWSPVVSIKF